MGYPPPPPQKKQQQKGSFDFPVKPNDNGCPQKRCTYGCKLLEGTLLRAVAFEIGQPELKTGQGKLAYTGLQHPSSEVPTTYPDSYQIAKNCLWSLHAGSPFEKGCGSLFAANPPLLIRQLYWGQEQPPIKHSMPMKETISFVVRLLNTQPTTTTRYVSL